MGYNTLEPNQGYGESHNNNRETWVTTLQNQIRVMVNHTQQQRDMGYNTLEPNQGYGESHNNKQRNGLHSRTKLGLW